MENIVEGKIVVKAKNTFAYKLIKTSEGTIVLIGLSIGIFLGWFALIPAVAIMAAYILINVLGLSNEPLYVLRDKYFKKED